MVTDPSYDRDAIADVGAVYLFNDMFKSAPREDIRRQSREVENVPHLGEVTREE